MSVGGVAPEAAPRRWGRPRRRVVLGGIALVLVLAFALGAGLATLRYLPALDEARALRTDLETMVDRVKEAGLGIDGATMDALDADLAAARGRFDRLESLLATDPLVAVARALPPTAANVRGADDVVAAAGDLLDAVGEGLVVGRRFVDIRDVQATDPARASALSQLVELMATTRDSVSSAAASVASARQHLAAVPDGLVGQVESVRDAMTARIDTYGPLLDTYVEVSARLPSILGWDGPRRYLVLTQDPAELRPTGGFLGTYAIVGFDRGRIVELRFRDTGPLDFPFDYPWIDPPRELADYLLGPKQPWQFADANWSPDFPTSARDALRLYTNESGDGDLDGVLAITTFTIDELLKATGPIAVPGFDTTVSPGETTMTVLERTRVPRTPGENAKAFLFAFANSLVAAMLALPSQSWGDLVGTVETLGRDRLLQAWFVDAADQAAVAGGGFSGAVRDDAGDFVYLVDSNVAPVSKLNIVTTRSLDLDIRLDAVGNASNSLQVTWDNAVDSAAGDAIMALENVGGRILGMYSRVVVPERSRVGAVSGGGAMPLSDPAVVENEAGRMVIGAYLQVPPGSTSLTYAWTSPYAAEADDEGGTYRLTIQKQPGLLAGPLTLSILVPDGYRITAASPELIVAGATATFSGTFDRDIVVGLRYAIDQP